jgi:stathmin
MKIEEASRKKDEINQEFISYAKDNLVTKMEHSEIKRDAIISDMRDKIRVHSDDIKKNKSLMDQQKEKELEAFNEKLNYASNLREENIKRILERLRKHVSNF